MKILAFLNLLVIATAYGDSITMPNPGGSVVVTATILYNIGYVDTPVTERADLYSTTVVVLLNGNQISSQSYAFAFGSTPLNIAIVQADNMLASFGAGFSAPLLVSSNSTLQSSVTAAPPVYTCDSPGIESYVTGFSSETVSTFGPAIVKLTPLPTSVDPVSRCEFLDFYVLPGQLDINEVTNANYSIPRNVITTNTFLTTQVYEILGTSAPSAVPEPGSMALIPVGAAAMVVARRSRYLRELLKGGKVRV